MYVWLTKWIGTNGKKGGCDCNLGNLITSDLITLINILGGTPIFVHTHKCDCCSFTVYPPNVTSAAPKLCKLYMHAHCRYGKKGLGCSYPHPPMCFKFIKSDHKGCSKVDSLNIHILNYAAHPYYHISVTVLNATSIMLQTQLGKTSIKTYSELMYLKEQLFTHANDAYQFTSLSTIPPHSYWHHCFSHTSISSTTY